MSKSRKKIFPVCFQLLLYIVFTRNMLMVNKQKQFVGVCYCAQFSQPSSTLTLKCKGTVTETSNIICTTVQ